jgi:site-specific recombinase XerC
MAIRNRALLELMLALLDLEDCLLTATGKRYKLRRVPFSSGVRILLERWLAVRGNEPESLFWLQAAGIRMIFRHLPDDVGLPRFQPPLLHHQSAHPGAWCAVGPP